MQLVKDLMLPIENYVTVHEDTSVAEAIRVLEKMRDQYEAEGREYRPRQLVVLDRQNRVVGKLDQMDVITSLEPKYRTEPGSEAIKHISTSGLSPELLKDLMRWYSLWGESFEERCRKVLQMTVQDCMHKPRRDEYVKEEESLETAVHQMVLGRHPSLLVTSKDTVIGILRLSDVFEQISRVMEENDGHDQPIGS